MVLLVDAKRDISAVVAKLALYGVGTVVGLFGLSALVVAVIVRDCIRRNPLGIRAAH